jgi:hypothetical protein
VKVDTNLHMKRQPFSPPPPPPDENIAVSHLIRISFTMRRLRSTISHEMLTYNLECLTYDIDIDKQRI